MNSNKYALTCFLLLLLGISACKKDDPPVITLPVVITHSMVEVLSTVASGGGEVVSDGGASVTFRGLVWHTDSVMSLSNMTGYNIDGAGKGVFTSHLDSLLPNTEYFVRAYAINSEGAAYGEAVMFKTKDTIPSQLMRDQALQDYNDNFLGSLVSDLQWTGSSMTCVHGTISEDAKQKTLQRLNYFRRLAGLSDNVVEDKSLHEGCQRAALIFRAENNLSQNPPQHWACWTLAGYNAAMGSNIAWGTSTSGNYCVHTTYGITGFIRDDGVNNKVIRERSAFLMPGLTKIGIGSTSTTSCMQWDANCAATGNSPEYIAYPAPGYIPNHLTFARWSFTLPGYADFSNATVTMTDSTGASVPLTVVNKPINQTGARPLNHLVWEPDINPAGFTSDVKYTVTISGVAGAPKSTYIYGVMVFPVTPGF
jgi:hypothetical protein